MEDEDLQRRLDNLRKRDEKIQTTNVPVPVKPTYLMGRFGQKFTLEEIEEFKRIDRERKEQEANLFPEFVSVRVDRTGDPQDIIPIVDGYINFKQWHADAYPKKHTPQKDVFIKEMNKLIGEEKGQIWYGVRIKITTGKFVR